MKKSLTLLAGLLLLAGCSNSQTTTSTVSTTVDNADTVVVSTESGLKITNQDLYSFLLENYGASYILDDVLQSIASIVVTDEEEFKADAEELKTMYEMFIGEDLDGYAKENLGYDTFDDYLNEVYIPNLKVNKMAELYIDEHKAELTEQNYFKSIRMITVATQEEAQQIISSILGNEKTFEEAFAQFSTDTTYENGEMGVVSNLSSTLDQAIIDILPSFKTVALYTLPVALDDGNYGVIDIMDIDTANMADEIDGVLKSSTEINSQAQAAILKEHNFKVYDSSLIEGIKAINADFITE